MQEFFPILTQSRLFSGIREEDLPAMLSCLQASLRPCRKGDTVFSRGETLTVLVLVLQGQLMLQRQDYWGNRSLLQVITPGEMFGEAYAAPDSGPLQHDILCVQDSLLLCLDAQRVLTTCSTACLFHTRIIHNLFCALSDKNRFLVGKLTHMERRTTREKLLSYLSEQAAQQNRSEFTIPFSRQELADYLCVERSAMSAELSRLRRDGLLAFEKNRFTLHKGKMPLENT